MLKIAICDDDLKFTGELETLVMKECQRSSTRCETDRKGRVKTWNVRKTGKLYVLFSGE